MNEVKNNELRERQIYVPASVKVIEVTSQRAILSASNPNGTSPYERETW